MKPRSLKIIIISLIIIFSLVWFNNLPDEGAILIPVSIHLVDDGGDYYTTDRNLENIIKLFGGANQIWEQGQIEFIIEDIDTIEIDGSKFSSVFEGEIQVLMERQDFDRGMINAYFAKYFDANGVAFSPQGVFVVADLTTVNDYRTTAHELGHLLGLHHVQGRENLMFKGANGEVLSEEEIDIARRNARKVYLHI